MDHGKIISKIVEIADGVVIIKLTYEDGHTQYVTEDIK